tara:strand:- start:165 stop:767 length:603 start_codon:yes stop_codon:yes gene_type:complete
MDGSLKKELIGIYFFLPTLLYFSDYKSSIFLVLYIIFFYTIYVLKKKSDFSFSTLIKKVDWDYCFLFFFIFLILGYFYTKAIEGNLLFEFPKNNFYLWLFVMFAYPFLSVIPQEIIYRVFFFYRYNCLFNKKKSYLILMNIIVFSYGHIVFQNFHAVFITAVASPLFAYAYLKKSFITCIVIHSIGGQIIFTFGLGKYFY